MGAAVGAILTGGSVSSKVGYVGDFVGATVGRGAVGATVGLRTTVLGSSRIWSNNSGGNKSKSWSNTNRSTLGSGPPGDYRDR